MILTREAAGRRIHRRTVLEYALESQSQSASVTSPAISLRSIGGLLVGRKMFHMHAYFHWNWQNTFVAMVFFAYTFKSYYYDEL
jgi:hypothetical protein